MKKAREYVMIIAGIVLLAIGLVLLKAVEEPQGILLTLPYICVGIGSGCFGCGMGNLINKKTLEKHPELRKQKEIEEKDERNVAVANAAKAKAYDVMQFMFGALMVSFALMNVELKVILLMVATYLFAVGCGIYYRIKYDKKM